MFSQKCSYRHYGQPVPAIVKTFCHYKDNELSCYRMIIFVLLIKNNKQKYLKISNNFLPKDTYFSCQLYFFYSIFL